MSVEYPKFFIPVNSQCRHYIKQTRSDEAYYHGEISGRVMLNKSAPHFENYMQVVEARAVDHIKPIEIGEGYERIPNGKTITSDAEFYNYQTGKWTPSDGAGAIVTFQHVYRRKIKYPKFYVPDSPRQSGSNKFIAYYRYDSDFNGRTFHIDGTSFEFGNSSVRHDMKEVTETEALDRLNEPDRLDEPDRRKFEDWLKKMHPGHEFYRDQMTHLAWEAWKAALSHGE